ncbi:MAG: hypothetical protein FJ026_11435 [Chloroflexi bacterium]|nr:hypothetical protein [Chloroflexota bacterium]
MQQYTALGNLEAAQRHLREAELAVVDKPVEDRKALAEDVILRFEEMKAYGDENIYESRQECLWIHQELQVKYETLWTLNGNEGPSPAGQDIQREALKCAERSP